jgi:outer membrane protein assembly factor BamA
VAVSIAEPTPGPFRRVTASLMWMPVLRYDDGYGFTYGARVSAIDLLGARTRLSVPLTWGGERRASVEWERTFGRGPISRVLADAGVHRRENPAYEIADRREFVRARLERAFGSTLRTGVHVLTEGVAFGDARDRATSAGLDVTLDTRRDPAFPRQAVFVSAAWERRWFDHTADTSRIRADVRGYVGLVRQSVLVLRAQQDWSADALPDFDRALLGGAPSLRGRPLGYRTGDRLTAGSLEIRLPISSPLRLGRAGIAVFADSGATTEHGQPMRTARFDSSVGAGFFVGATVFNVRVDVAHAIGGGTRGVFGLGVTF